MDNKTAGLRVGLFALAGLASILALIFLLSGAALHPGIPYETYFQESVQGVDVGSAVKFRGVTIGKVTDVGLVTAEYPPAQAGAEDTKVYQQIVVRFEVDPRKIGKVASVDSAIAHGLRVQITPQGITGLAYLDLSFVSPALYPAGSVPWQPDSTVIPSRPSTITQVQDALQQVLSTMSQANIGQIANNIASLTAALNQEITSGDVHQAAASANTLLTTLNSNIDKADLPGTTASVRNLAGGPETTQILKQLDQTTASLAKISAQLPSVIAASQATINQASETTADLQAQLAPVLKELRTTSANLRDLSDDLARNPARAISGAPPPDNEGQGDKP